MASTTGSAEWRLVYREDLRAIVCVDCQQAFSFVGLKRHGHRKHLAVSLLARRRVIESLPPEARTATIAGIRYPEEPIAPLEILKEPVAGLWCRECGQVALFKHHLGHLCERAQCEQADGDARIERCLAQVLVAELRHRKYFRVRAPEVAELRPRTAATEQAHGELEAKGPVWESRSNDAMAEWMRETGWREYWQEHGFTLRQMHESAAEVPDDPRRGRPSQLKMLFDQCCVKVEDILDRMYNGGVFARRILCNFNIDESALNGPAVRRPLRQETIKAHATLWARFVVFCMRVNHGELDGPIVKFTREQGRLLEQLADGQDVLAEFSLSFIRCGPFQGNGLDESPLLVFMMAASTTESYEWKPIKESARAFESLLYVIQGFLYDASAQAHPELKRDFLLHLKEQCSQWLTLNRPTVGSRFLRILREGRRLAPQQVGESPVTWSSDGNRLVYDGKTMALADLRRFLHGVLGEAEELVRELVLYRPRVLLDDLLSSKQLADLRDDMQNAQQDYHFLWDTHNDLERLAVCNMQAIQDDADLRARWVTSVRPDGGVVLCQDAIKRYLALRTRFLEVLAVLYLLLGGLPPRAAEVAGLQWANSDVKRGLFAADGKLMLLIGYGRNGDQPSLPRFMPERVLRLYVLYLAAVEPFCESLLGLLGVETRDFWASLFLNEQGLEMGECDVARAMEEATAKHLGLSLTAQAWRHVAFAIYRRKLCSQSQVVARLLETTGLCVCDTEEEEEGDEDDPMNAIDEGRSARMEQLRYVLGFDTGSNLEWAALKSFQNVSALWHEFWGFVGPAWSSEPPRAVDDGLEHLLAALREVYGPAATWRSEEQRRAFAAVFCERRKHVAVVLPSGGGKSSLIWVAARLEAGRGLVTVVVVPLSVLIPDLLAKARELGIDAEQWVASHDDRRSRPVNSTLLFVSADMVGTDEFLRDLGALQTIQQVSRVIIDEVHLERCQAGFRPSMDNVHRLQHPGSQLVLLTATLPPVAVSKVFWNLWMPRDSTVVVRGETSRPNIAYAVQRCGTLHDLESAVLRYVRGMASGARAVVYCRKANQVVDWANRLSAHWYHQPLDGADEQLRQWIGCKGSPVLVATTASSCGVDAKNVTLVLHIERPYDLLEFVQATESAGRPPNVAARSVILISSEGDAKIQLFEPPRQGPADLAMSEYLEGLTCRRQAIAKFMDEPGATFTRATCREYQVQPCDVCVAAARWGLPKATPSGTRTATPGSIIQAVSRLVAPFAT